MEKKRKGLNNSICPLVVNEVKRREVQNESGCYQYDYVMYTSETKKIERTASIKDTMMYDICLAFYEMGHNVTLIGGKSFKILQEKNYPFDVLWWEYKWQKLFMPNCLLYISKTYKYI